MKFWDTSAIIPLLVEQETTGSAREWYNADPLLAVWTLTGVEITSGLWRLVREGRMPESKAHEAEDRADALFDGNHVVVDTDRVKSIGRRLLRVHGLTAADAMQVGAALVWAGEGPHGRVVHTFDTRLAAAARREGFDVP